MLLGLLPFALCWDVEVRWKMEEKLGEVFLWAERRRLPDRTVPVLSISKSSPWKASALATFVSLHQVEMLWTDNIFLEYSTFFFLKKRHPPQQNPTTNQLKKKQTNNKAPTPTAKSGMTMSWVEPVSLGSAPRGEETGALCGCLTTACSYSEVSIRSLLC